MDSKRRQVELHIWDRPFFMELDQTEKLFYWFVVCKCDNTGVYRHNAKLATFYCDNEVGLQQFVGRVNFDEKRIEIISEGTLWLRDFIPETWGTLSPGNNLGKSCYKLLAKHGLLSRFISLHPNHIKVEKFIKEIEEGNLEAPLPQAAPDLTQENGVSEEYEGQGRGRAGTINNNIPNNTSNSFNNSDNIEKLCSKLLAIVPESHKFTHGPNEFQQMIGEMVDHIHGKVDDPGEVILETASVFPWEDSTWEEFREALTVSEYLVGD